VPGRVPTDACAVPELWPWQMPWVTMGDIVWALRLEGSARSLWVLRGMLPGVPVEVRVGGVKPIVTTRRLGIPKIHLEVYRNPHLQGTVLYRNWHRYRENMPVDVYRRLGGSSRCLEGDVRRGLVRVA